MRTQGIYLNISRRNDDLPEMIEEYSEKFNLSKADTVAEILRANQNLLLTSTEYWSKKADHLGGYFLMPYEKNKTACQDNECFARERNIIDVLNMKRFDGANFLSNLPKQQI